MKTNSDKNILVAGGAGFIGSHLCERLVKEGYNVLCVDNLYTGKIENIKHLLSKDSFSFMKQDITNSFYRDDLSLTHIARG